jgi:hypothetical protein
LVDSRALKSVHKTLSRLLASACAVTAAGHHVPAPGHAVRLGGPVRPGLVVVGHSRPLPHAALRCLAMPVALPASHTLGSTRRRVRALAQRLYGQPTACSRTPLPRHRAHPGVPPPLCTRRPAASVPAADSEVTRALTFPFPPAAMAAGPRWLVAAWWSHLGPILSHMLLRRPEPQSPIPTSSRITCHRAPIWSLHDTRPFRLSSAAIFDCLQAVLLESN